MTQKFTPEYRAALIAEAYRLAGEGANALNVCATLLDLIAADWQPEPKVDAATLAVIAILKAWHSDTAVTDSWDIPAMPGFTEALAAYRAGQANGTPRLPAETREVIRRAIWYGRAAVVEDRLVTALQAALDAEVGR